MAEEQDDTGTWLSPRQAAQALGVSERTLRRHVRSNRYATRQEGRRLLIRVPSESQALAPADVPASADALVLAQILTRLAQVERVVANQAEHNHRLERLEWLVQRLLNRVEALQRPRKLSPSTPPQPEPDEGSTDKLRGNQSTRPTW